MREEKEKKVIEFLRESNAIEGVYDQDSLNQAVMAWNYLVIQVKITPEVICKTHQYLMINQKLQPWEKGKFRMQPVYIGGREGTDATKISEAIDAWCDDMNKKHQGSNMAMTKLLHVRYERIHPFIDGNGRTGRMFMNWWRLLNKLPLLIIHEGIEQMNYYQWFD